MNHYFWRESLHERLDFVRVTKAPCNKFCAWVNSRPVALSKVVEDGHFVPLVDELFNASRSDISGAPGDEKFHALFDLTKDCGPRLKSQDKRG